MVSGVAPAFYQDVFLAFLSSVLNKRFKVEVGTYETATRIWELGTGPISAGKSPAWEPAYSAMQKAMRAAGSTYHTADDRKDFHVLTEATDATAVSLMHDAQGYLLIASPDAFTMVDQAQARNMGSFSGAKDNISFFNFLGTNCATGRFSKTNMRHEDNARRAKQKSFMTADLTKQVVMADPDLLDTTNVGFNLLQPLKSHDEWWARIATTTEVGLVQRFLFTYGDSMEKPTMDPNCKGMDKVLVHVLTNYFVLVLTTAGSKIPEKSKRSLCC